MTRFDHIMIMVSIVIGLGVIKFLTDFGSFIEKAPEISTYPPHTVWTIVTFILLVQLWWAIWSYRLILDKKWTYLDYVIVLLAGTFLYMAGELALPTVKNDPIDLEEYFESVSFSYFLCISIYLILSLALRRRVRKISLLAGSNLFRFFALIIAIAAAGSAAVGLHEEVFHNAFALAGVLSITVFI